LLKEARSDTYKEFLEAQFIVENNYDTRSRNKKITKRK
jgi:hypothetical protein